MYYIHVLGNFSNDPEDDFMTLRYSSFMDYEDALDEIMDKGFKIVKAIPYGGSSVYVQPSEEEEDEGFEDYEWIDSVCCSNIKACYDSGSIVSSTVQTVFESYDDARDYIYRRREQECYNISCDRCL